MDGPPEYAKRLRGEDVRYLGSVDDDPAGALEARISLADDDLEDAFRMELPGRSYNLTIGQVLDTIFPEDEAEQYRVIELADLAANPDYPEIYEGMLEVVDQWREGRCLFALFANHGPQVEPSHPASRHLSECRFDGDEHQRPMLDLVIEPRYEVLAHFAESGGDTDGLLAWMRGLVLIYFMDKHRLRLSAAPEEEEDRALVPIAEELASRGLIAADAETRVYHIAEEGRRFLGGIISETEGYIDRYGVFDDVLYDWDAGTVEFGTGLGEDLRPQVYWSEGVDPIRLVFLLRLYDSTLDGYAAEWRRLIHGRDLYDDILRPVLDHRSIDEETLGWIVDAGLSHLEEAAEEADLQASQKDTIDRIRSRESGAGNPTPRRRGSR